MHMDLYAVTILLLRGYHHLTTVSSVNSELFFSTRAHCAWQNMGAFYNGVWHCPTQDPCLYIGKTWIWLNDYSLDKDLPRLSHSKSSGQWLNVQVETSGIPQGLVLGLTLLTSLLLIWTVGLSACSASLPTASSCEVPLTQCREWGTSNVLPSRETLAGLRGGACESFKKFSKVKCKVLHLNPGNTKHKYRTENRTGLWSAGGWKSGTCSPVSQPYPGLHQKKCASREEVVIVPLYFILMRHPLQYWVQLWGPQHKKNINLLE